MYEFHPSESAQGNNIPVAYWSSYAARHWQHGAHYEAREEGRFVALFTLNTHPRQGDSAIKLWHHSTSNNHRYVDSSTHLQDTFTQISLDLHDERLRSYPRMQPASWTSHNAGSRTWPAPAKDVTMASSRYPDHEMEDDLAELVAALSFTEFPVSSAPEQAISDAAPARIRAARGLLTFKKTWLYSNSRLPPYMPPMVVYMPTWRLFCLAAQASLNVYRRPRGEEREHFIKSDWQNSTKAMVLQSRPIDDQNVIVFAVRGSQMNFVDWSVNFRPEPTSPAGFLDDAGNACHAGFLTVAKAMVGPVAARLRQLLEQNPSRTASSLVITGHSAGGAVAALLYSHMLSHSVDSELHSITDCFKRVHCITFGAPPLTLLPLTKPANSLSKKNIFMSFVNEGDPIARAEKAYVKSLARALAAPAPQLDKPSDQRLLKKMSSRFLKSEKAPPKAQYWPVPPATLSNPGRIIVLREEPGSGKLQAVTVTDQQLRGVLFGDPANHAMALYKQRIDQLAISAVTGSAVT